ncbi:ABC transporter ATP-binding protein [Anaerophilus nitritogenes]|uniref:ABC transporter ATP-binding protein n=1 Tax=Anaerophilus nitritogenes TaxID=2498136 RepID=UPI00101D29CE|nr:ATP-binding cassette domain-containing protein [Anaerophilus nitritogenes]
MYIEIKNLSKKYKNEYVLNNINLSLDKNNIYGFVGINGSGKTMLFKAIAGLIIPTNGDIFINEKKLHKDISFPESMGVIIEKPAFLDYLSGYENLKVLSKIKNKIEDEQIFNILKLLHLEEHASKPVKQYSLGMKQRLGIAQAIMEDPELLILDEPFNALDKTGIEIVRSILMKMKEEGKIILLTSHNKEDITLLCNEVFEIKNGEIISSTFM